jgi:hypothetical protein
VLVAAAPAGNAWLWVAGHLAGLGEQDITAFLRLLFGGLGGACLALLALLCVYYRRLKG